MGSTPTSRSPMGGAMVALGDQTWGIDLVNKWKDYSNYAKSVLGLGAPTKTLDAAAQNKDPLSLPTWAEQSAAAEGKVKRLLTNPIYQKSSGEQQDAYRKKIYDMYVAPAYTKFGRKPPDPTAWLEGSRTAKMLNPRTYGASPGVDAVSQLGMGLDDTGAHISLFGARLGRLAMLREFGPGAALGNNETFNSHIGTETLDKIQNKAQATIFDRWEKSAKSEIRDDNYFFETHPRDTFLGQASKWTGGQILTLPLFDVKVVTALGADANITKALAAAPWAQKLVTRTLNGAFLGFSNYMLGHGEVVPNKEAGKEAVGFAAAEGIGGALFDRVGDWLKKIKIDSSGMTMASDSAIKEWSARQMVTGGDPLVHGTTARAAEELRAEAAELHSPGTGEVVPPKPGEPTTGEAPPPKPPGGPDEPPPGGGRVEQVEEAKPTGVKPEEKPVEAKPAETEPPKKDAAWRRANDPILHQLISGDKMALESLAVRHYGQSFGSLPKEFQDKIVARRLELMEEAKPEMAIHNPELNKQEIQSNLDNLAKTSKYAAGTLAKLKAMGIDTAQLVNDANIKQMAKETGNHDTEAVVNRIARSIVRKGQKEAEITARKAAQGAEREADRIARGAAKIQERGGSYQEASDWAARQKRLGPPPKREARVSASEFASHNVDTKAYFINPFKKGGSAKDAIIKANREAFLDKLKEADKNLIKFESPLHRMLYHYANRDKLPAELSDKLLKMIKDELKVKHPDIGPEGLRKVEIEKYADRCMAHLHILAKSGRLSSEKNMFRSTNLFGAPTPYQTDLLTEVDFQEIEFLKNTIKMHPETLSFMKTLVRNLQANRAEGLVTPQHWHDYNAAIDHVISGQAFGLKKPRAARK